MTPKCYNVNINTREEYCIMEKFKKYYKIPLLVVSAIMFVAFLTVIIVQSCSHYSNGKYAYEGEIEGVKTEMSLTIEGKKGITTSEQTTYIEPTYKSTEEFPYEIKNDQLLILQEDGRVMQSAKITPYSVTIDLFEDGTLFVRMVNHGAYALLGCSIAFASLGAIGVVVTAVLMALDKKKANKAENTEKAA